MEKPIWEVSDISGCSVYDVAGEYIGKLVDVLHTGANDVWVINTGTAQDKEMLVPALRTVIKEVNVKERKITIDLPRGLKEIYEGFSNK